MSSNPSGAHPRTAPPSFQPRLSTSSNPRLSPGPPTRLVIAEKLRHPELRAAWRHLRPDFEASLTREIAEIDRIVDEGVSLWIRAYRCCCG